MFENVPKLEERPRPEVTRANICNFLNALSRWYKAHPEAPLPYELNYSLPLSAYTHSEHEFKAAVTASGAGKKFYGDKWNPSGDGVEFYPEMGQFTGALRIRGDRSAVCKKVVVGIRVVAAEPESTIIRPARPERTEEIVEWECGDNWTLPPAEGVEG